MTLSADSFRILNALTLRTKRSFYGTRYGSHRSLRRGHGMEFAEYRNYEVGDNPRTIDWNLYGRSDKLYSKRFLEEENVAVYIIIDGSRSITHPDLAEKWECARCIALATAYTALSSHDIVTVSVLGGATSQKFSGGRSFTGVSDFLTSQRAYFDREDVAEIDLTREVTALAARLTFPGICIFVSDFLYSREKIYEMFAPLRSRNLEMHAIQILGSNDMHPTQSDDSAFLRDSETGEQQGVVLTAQTLKEYKGLLRVHNDSVRSLCLDQGSTFIQAQIIDKQSAEESAIVAVTSMGIFV